MFVSIKFPYSNKQEIQLFYSKTSFLDKEFQFYHFIEIVIQLIELNQQFYTYYSTKIMKRELEKLLKKYEVDDDEVLEQVMQYKNQTQKWQIFMDGWISKDKREVFMAELRQIDILKSKYVKTANVLFDAYDKLDSSKIDLSKIYQGNINTSKWSDDLMEEIQAQIKNSLLNNLKKAQNFSKLLDLQKDKFIDILARRSDLKQYFDQIKLASKALGKQGRLYMLIESLTYREFIIFLVKYAEKKQIIGSLLNSQGIPLPILVQTQKSCQIYPQLCMDVLSFQSVSFILNIGTPKTRKSGKSFFITKLLSIKESYIQDCSFVSSLCVTNKLIFSKQSRILLGDYNGQFSKNMNKTAYKLIQKLSASTSLLIIHAKQEQILIEQILLKQQYEIICKNAQKIIIFIRDVDERPNAVLKKVEKSIPQCIKSKTMVRCLKNFSKIKSTHQHKEQLEEICKRQYNKLSKRNFSYLSMCERQQIDSFQKNSKQIEQLIKEQIDNPDYSKESIIPFIVSIQRQSQLNIKLKNQQKDLIKSQQYNNEILLIRQKRKILKLSRLLEKLIKLLSKNFIGIKVFQQYLSQWKNRKQGPLRSKFLELTELLSNKVQKSELEQAKIKQEILITLIKRGQFQISIDKIINELIFYNLSKKEQNLSRIIENYYSSQVQKMNPINLVDGNTLNFGNPQLQKYFQSIKDKYFHKKIYIVSIIGSQSSAKSTLLNYLFRCRFQTSAGRCTKGIYLNICELGEIVVIVLDTQGLLSVLARDKTFDHQIAAFVLKISNLVIINNKGQLTNNLTSMLEVCLYVLQCLHKDQARNSFASKKILFSVRDQCKPQQRIQQQIAGNIKNALQSLKMSSNLIYSDFISIQSNDIFSFPNAFYEEKGLVSEVGSIKLCEQNFGNCILGMRKRIIDCLKETSPFNRVHQFYQEAKNVWHNIQTCGKQIMHYKTIAQIRARESIQNLFKSKSEQYINQISDDYQIYINKIQGLEDVELFKKYQVQFDSLQSKHIQGISKTFSQECKQQLYIENQQLIKSCDREISAICRQSAGIFKEKFNEHKRKADLKNNEDQFQSKIQQQFKTYLGIQNSTEGKQIQLRFKQFVRQKLEQKQKLIFYFDETKFNMELKDTFQRIRAYQGKWKINHIEDCMKEYYNYQYNFQLNRLIKASQTFVSQYELKQIEIIIRQSVGGFQTFLTRNAQINLSIFLGEIKRNAYYFWNKIEQTIKSLDQKLKQFRKNWWISKIQIHETQLKQLLLGILFETIKFLTKQMKKTQNNALYQSYKKIGEKYNKNMEQLIKAGGDLLEIMNIQINNYISNFFQKSVQKCVEIVEKNLLKIKSLLNPTNIFDKALKRTFLSDASSKGKEYYIQCFKLIKNVNQYLFQVMCQQPIIKERRTKIKQAIEESFHFYRSKHDRNLKLIKRYLNQKKDSSIQDILKQMNMFGIASLLQVSIIKQQATNLLYQALKQKSSEIELIILRNLQMNQVEIQSKITNFITNDLKKQIIGCQACCPICGMKCSKQFGHAAGHKLGRENHCLQAFGGICYTQQKTPLLVNCSDKSVMKYIWTSRQTEKNFKDLQQFINQNHKEWSQQFRILINDPRFYSSDSSQKQLEIWSNIEEVIINHKYNFMKRSDNALIIQKSKKGFALNDEDMQQQFLLPVSKIKIKLKQF